MQLSLRNAARSWLFPAPWPESKQKKSVTKCKSCRRHKRTSTDSVKISLSSYNRSRPKCHTIWRRGPENFFRLKCLVLGFLCFTNETIGTSSLNFLCIVKMGRRTADWRNSSEILKIKILHKLFICEERTSYAVVYADLW